MTATLELWRAGKPAASAIDYVSRFHAIRARTCTDIEDRARAARLRAIRLDRTIRARGLHIIGLFLEISALTLAFGALLGFAGYAYVTGTAPPRLAVLHDTMERWSGVMLEDADRCLLGLIPGSREGLADFRDGRDLPADEKTIAVTKVPDGFWDVAVALEHRSIGTWRTLPNIGVDPLSLAQAIYDTASGHPRGASTLPQLVAGALLKTDHGSRREWMARKTRELLYGAALYSAYSLSPDDSPNFRQLAATYLPLAQSSSSGRGGVLYGLGVTGLILFGKPPGSLSLGEQAVLAAAIKTPIVLAPPSDRDGQRLAQTVFDRVKTRALYGLAQAYRTTAPRVLRAAAEIRGMTLPTPHLCARLRPHLPDDPVEAFRVSFNPVWRAQYFAGEEISQVVSELKTLAGPHFRERVHAVRLTLRAGDNLPFKQAVRAELAAIEKKWSSDLAIGLRTGSERPVGDILLAASDQQGAIRLFYQSPERPLLDVPRATGSVSKILAALSLGQAGSPEDYYCNLRIDGVLRNADGDTGRRHCTEPGGVVTARESFGRSLNLPIFHALRAIPDRSLRDLAERTGFVPYRDTSIRTAVAFGMVSASPGDMLRLMTAIKNSARGDPATARAPRIVDAIAWRNTPAKTRPPVRALDLSPILDTSATRFALDVLAAPLAPNGTAAALSSCERAMNWQLAKTGTVAQGGRIGSKLLLASGRYGHRPITMIGVLGTAADNGDIAPLTTGTLARIMCKAAGPGNAAS